MKNGEQKNTIKKNEEKIDRDKIQGFIDKYARYNLTPVEATALSQSIYELIYAPNEKIPSIIVDNFPKLGKLSALRFIEWVKANPGGVISLPTGKTPEHFIRWVQHYLQHWGNKDVSKDLEENGIDTSSKPDMKSLHFVQIDEFYPMNPQQHNSFYYYVNKYYIKGFGLDNHKAILLDCEHIGSTKDQNVLDLFKNTCVDLSLRYRKPKNYLEKMQQQAIARADQYCTEYEERIRKLGGIGFFLGGIGPDGHIGFNVRGSDHYCTTRLTHTNYETEAAAASDLGGIEISRGRLVITIGLNTIAFNPKATAIIIAAGEAKSGIVAESIQTEISNIYPASVLQSLPSARFYLTRGAAACLDERALADISHCKEVNDEKLYRVIMNVAFNLDKNIEGLTEEDAKKDKFAKIFFSKTNMPWKECKAKTINHVKHSIQEGLKELENKVFLHTAPHHDDIELGYLAYIQDQIIKPSNRHYFAYMTSGFTAVTNSYVCKLLQTMLGFIEDRKFEKLYNVGYFEANNNSARDVETMMYLDGIARRRIIPMEEAQSRRMLRNAMIVFEDDNLQNIKERVQELINYFETQYPGKKDLPYIQKFKGMIREWEADVHWAYFGFTKESVRHLRLGFYKGDIFTEEPTIDRDVKPILKLMHEVKPDYVTLALDPEGSGPDTHYKVLQAISHALQIYEKETGRNDIQVLGYRNIWFKFHPCESNLYVPVSIAKLAALEDAFLASFVSQKDASFPSYAFDGPFSGLARKIQSTQHIMIQDLMGEDFFFHNEDPRIRASHGMVFLKKLSTQELFDISRELKKTTEEL